MSDQPISEDVTPKTKKTKRVAMRLPSVLLDLGPGDVHEPASTSWIQIAKPVGAMKGHPAGMFSLDQKCFAEIIANFRDVDGGRIPLDFEHASESPAHLGDIPAKGAPAQGWITDLQVRADGALWACVEWGTLARDYVRSNKYRYVSPAVRFGSKHPQTGKPIGARLSSLALTNQPFLGRGDDGSNGLTPITAKDSVEPVEADVIEAKNAGNKFGDHTPDKQPKAPKALSDDDDATMTAATVECAECAKLKAQCAELSNALSAQTAKRKKQKAKVKDLKAQLAATQLELKQSDVAPVVDDYIGYERACGRLAPDRESLLILATSNPDAFLNTHHAPPRDQWHLGRRIVPDEPRPRTDPLHHHATMMSDRVDALPAIDTLASSIEKAEPSLGREGSFVKAHEQLSRMTRERRIPPGGV